MRYDPLDTDDGLDSQNQGLSEFVLRSVCRSP